jgi:hypothetical protein
MMSKKGKKASIADYATEIISGSILGLPDGMHLAVNVWSDEIAILGYSKNSDGRNCSNIKNFLYADPVNDTNLKERIKDVIESMKGKNAYWI